MGRVARRLLPLLLVTALGAACATSSTAATSPARAVAQAKAEWLEELRAAAKTGDRATRFPSPSRAILVERLRRAESRYGFRIVPVRMLRPLQGASVIVIRSDDKQRMARAIPRIIEAFNPHHPTPANPSGYDFEGYFLVAETSRGVPYLATFNHWRAPHVGGGEWAAGASLYPFPHGQPRIGLIASAALLLRHRHDGREGRLRGAH